MSKELNSSQFRNLIRGLLKEGKLKEEDLGIWNDFDEVEFDTNALAAAKADIQSAGEKFTPLGQSKFEKNLDPKQFKADLNKAKLDLPNDKAELDNIARMMNTKKKHEKRFGAGSLNETGEWSDDEEGLAWIESLKHELELIQSELNLGIKMSIDDVRGFDKYQGPFAEITINGDHYKVWTNEDRGLWVDNFPIDNRSSKGNKPGFEGFPDQVADAINKHYSSPGSKPKFDMMDFMNENGEEFENLTAKNWGFNTKDLYNFLKSAMAEFMEGDSHLNYAEAAMVLESELEKHFNIAKKANEITEDPEKAKTAMGSGKILRPKDAEGTDITLKARVEDVDTGTAGRVIRFGVDENGNQTVHVDWIYSFGDAIVKSETYPKKIVVRDDNRIVRENQTIDSSLAEFAKAQEEANYWVYKNNTGDLNPQELELLHKATERTEELADVLDVEKFDYVAIQKLIDGFARQRNDEGYLEYNKNSEQEFEAGFNKDLEEGGGHSHTIGQGENKKPGNYPETLKRAGLNESEEDDTVFLVTNTSFNRAHHKDLIGKIFESAPVAEFDLVKRDDLKEDFDFAAAEREFHHTEEINTLEQYADKQISITNFDEMANIIFPNKKRVQSILTDLRQELDNMRVINNTVVASDNMDTQWLFKVKGIEGGKVILTFTGTAK
jgi:hypothetical protein